MLNNSSRKLKFSLEKTEDINKLSIHSRSLKVSYFVTDQRYRNLLAVYQDQLEKITLCVCLGVNFTFVYSFGYFS